MVFLALLAMGWQRPPAEEVLKNVFSHYAKLKSLSVKIIHHADFMADAKNSTDTVAWLAPKRFEIVSDKDSIPKLMSDGKRLTTFIALIPPLSEALEMESGKTKSWESRGGILLSCLMKGPMIDQWLHPAKPVKANFEFGKTLHWHDQEVSEIIETMSVRGASEHISYYLSANYQHLLGTELISGPETAWTQYADAVENPDLPKDLGGSIEGLPAFEGKRGRVGVTVLRYFGIGDRKSSLTADHWPPTTIPAPVAVSFHILLKVVSLIGRAVV